MSNRPRKEKPIPLADSGGVGEEVEGGKRRNLRTLLKQLSSASSSRLRWGVEDGKQDRKQRTKGKDK